MVKNRLLLVGLFASSLMLSACGGDTAPAPILGPDGQPTGQVVQQQQGPGLLGMFGASVAGNVVGNMLSGNRGGGVTHIAPAPSHTVVNKTVINKTIINHPPVVKTTPSVIPPKPTTSPQYRPSSPSVRSYSSSSSRSYSGGGSRGRR